MKRWLRLLCLCFTLALIVQWTQVAAQNGPREIGNLVLDGVPDIPTRIKERSAQYQNMRSASFVDWHPTKGMLIATRFGETSQLHYVAAPAYDRKQITFFNEPINGAKYSPDSSKLGFVFGMDNGGGEFYQYYWFDEETGRNTLITDGKSRNQSFTFSPRGDKAAFYSTKRNGKDFDLYLIDNFENRTARLAKELNGEWQIVDWSRDDRSILMRNYISANESYLYLFDLASGNLTEINSTNHTKKISYGSAAFSPDSKGIYYAGDEDSEFQRLIYYDLATKKNSVITANNSWNVNAIEIATDGTLAYTVNEGGISRLYLTNVTNAAQARRVDLPDGVIDNIKFDHQNAHLAFTLNSAQSPADAYSLDLKTNAVTRWTFSETGGLNAKNFVNPSLIEFATFDQVNGKPRMIPSFYYRPRDEGKKPFPVIISIHGGPEAQSQAVFSSSYQYWVNELGAAVLVPNVRGSDGYGKNYLMLDNGFQREDSVKDIGKLIDWIATRPELDKERIAVIGGSYGGYMSLATLTHYSDRIKCGVDVVGISNFVTFLESTQEYRRDLRRPEYGDERDAKMRAFLTNISPLTNANKITKPLLVVQGKNDPRVPITEAEQIVKTVRNNKGMVWYLMAKDEGHGFRKKPNVDFYTNTVSLFFEEYLLK